MEFVLPKRIVRVEGDGVCWSSSGVDAQQTVDIFIPVLLLTPEVRALTLPPLSLTAVSLPSTTFNEDLSCLIHKSNLTGLEVKHFSATLCLRPKLALFIQVHWVYQMLMLLSLLSFLIRLN